MDHEKEISGFLTLKKAREEILCCHQADLKSGRFFVENGKSMVIVWKDVMFNGVLPANKKAMVRANARE